MFDHGARESLLPQPASVDDGEAWLVSYLDVLTLLITLFVLLLSLAGDGLAGGEDARPASPLSPTARSMALAVGDIGPRGAGLKPRQEGLRPELAGLEQEGISVDERERGITLRIDESLLFDSGQARLTPGGGEVLQRLMATLQAFEGRISVEGHTDDVPIATPRFPSNWELSTARAIAVLRYLAEAGIEQARLRAIGYADTQPLERNATAEGRAANRRVELLLNRETT